MAQMIPEFYDDTTTPPGEKLFFDWLASECPCDWIAFHGLDLQAWNRSRKTEMDFLLLIPSTGILCIEIKSHEDVDVTRGVWRLNGEPQRIPPLKQAENAQKTFYRRLKSVHSELTRIPSTRLVVFPRALVSAPANIEHNWWEIWNQDDCLNSIADKSFSEKLTASLRSSIDHDRTLPKLDREVSLAEIRKLEDFLRPAFKSMPASIAEAKRRQFRMEDCLRDQQKPALNLFENNNRLILDGPAGTGKSLIALEVARLAKDQGLRTAILCFNAPMARKLKADTAIDQPLLIGGGIHSLFANMLEIEIPDNPPAGFWDNHFLDTVESKLLDEERRCECEFDVVVIDEAQDLLCRPRLMDVVECLVKDGFRKGQWLLAGDFQYQIFSTDDLRTVATTHLEALRDLPRTPYYKLTENCRNYRMVGDPALKLADMGKKDVYSDYMRGDGSHKFFNPKFYEKEKQQLDLLKSEIQRHINNGTSTSDMVILSFRSADKCTAKLLEGSGIEVRRIGRPGHGVQYGSIHEFKGLESNVVILTDVAQPTDQLDRDLFYVGMTRAIYSVSILVSQASQSWFLKAIQGIDDE